MPLSDREQQILSDIEARLREEDPKFARTVGTTTVSSHVRRQIKLALVGLALGFVLLLCFALNLWFGVAGFALMLGSTVYGGNMIKRLGQDDTSRLGGQLRGGLHRYLDGKRRGQGPRL
ncbi:MAG TPA: DUF3040 domain-containing protein [Egibacteraceae bacterium]|nr:DUF3040 domain-containing protein [Egibacteraceae bacterium]